MKPYIQGQLDAFCGVYCIINVTRVVAGRMTEDEAIKLFGKIMTYLESYKKLSRTSLVGNYTTDIEKILTRVIAPQYGIEHMRPFAEQTTVNKQVYFNRIKTFLKEHPKSAVIAYMEHDWWDHWSVIRDITPKSVVLFDSIRLTRIRIDKCLMKKGNPDSHYIFSSKKSFFVWKEKEQPL